MTEDQVCPAERERLRILRARMAGLQTCRMLAGGAHKRFVREVCHRPPEQITERQAAWIAILAWRYRRQMPADLVPAAEPPPLPPKPMPAPKPEKRWADRHVPPIHRRRGVPPQ